MEIRPCPLYVFLDPKGWIFWLHGFWIFFFPLGKRSNTTGEVLQLSV